MIQFSETGSHEVAPFFREIQFQHPDRDGQLHDFHINFRLLPSSNQPPEGKYAFVEVIAENGLEAGSVTGIALNRGTQKVFAVLSTANAGTLRDEGGNVIEKSLYPGIMRETIAQLLLSHAVDIWYSDIHLSPGALKMYDELLKKYQGKITEIEDDHVGGYVLKLG